MKFRILMLSVAALLHLELIAQKGNIKGTLKTVDGHPAEFVNVGLKDTREATTVNSKGEFEFLNIHPGYYILVTSFIGLETKEIRLEVKANETTYLPNIILNESSLQLKEVVISAVRSKNDAPVIIGRIPIKPIDLPQSVSSLDKELLDQQQTTRISDAVKNFNGVYVMGTSGGYQEELAGRGFAYGNSNTFKNGVRFNNSAMPETSSLERIEVMKGSTAILFGNVTAGGVINLITKKPNFKTGGEITFRTMSNDFYKPGIDVYGFFNNKIAYRLNSAYERSRSYRDEVSGERYYINPSLLFKLSSRTDLLIESDFLKDKRTADFGIGAINYKLIDLPRSRFIGVAWSYFATEQKGLTATITHRLNDRWNIKSVTSYQNLKSELFANQRPNANNQFIKSNGNWIRGIQRTNVDDNYYISQLDLTGKFSTGFLNHHFLVGADVDRYITNNTAFSTLSKYDSVNVFYPEKYKQRNDIPELSKKSLISSPVTRSGVYLQDLIGISEKFKLLAGLRFSYLETFSSVYTYNDQKTIWVKQYDNAFSPRIGIVFQPVKSSAIFASYSNSFSPNTGTDINNKPLPPSLTDQYEMGVKNDLCKGLITANVTFYLIKNSNLAQISLENGNSNSNIKELSGEITSKGVELDLTTKEWKGFSAIGGYSYNETRYTKSNTYIVGSLLRYNPNHTANFSLNYSFMHFKAKWLRGIDAGCGVLYIGDRMAGRSTRVTMQNDSYKLILIPAYTNLEVNIGYKIKYTSFRIKISNILDALSYNVHDDNSVNPIAPRQFTATISHRF